MIKILSILPSEQGTSCERCGRAISWVATVETEAGITHIGVDCAETLCNRKIPNAKKVMKIAAAFTKQYKTCVKVGWVYDAYLKSVKKPYERVRFTFADGEVKVFTMAWVEKYLPSLIEDIKTRIVKPILVKHNELGEILYRIDDEGNKIQ